MHDFYHCPPALHDLLGGLVNLRLNTSRLSRQSLMSLIMSLAVLVLIAVGPDACMLVNVCLRQYSTLHRAYDLQDSVIIISQPHGISTVVPVICRTPHDASEDAPPNQ
jgi:hypothetical protein